jgi:hypothetical protein
MASRLLLLSSLLAAAVHGAATNGTVTPAQACAQKCNAELSDCQGKPDPNESFCAANYAGCLGYDPYTPTFKMATECAVKLSAAEECAKKCNAALSDCQGKPDPNESTCAANYAACVGYNPYNGNFKLATACAANNNANNGTIYTTTVVDVLTTYCPTPTTLTVNGKTYPVTEPTTLTITDCPCTISKPVESATQPAATKPAVVEPSVVPTAGAGRVVPGALVLLGVAALF